jgi:hypothetical protein
VWSVGEEYRGISFTHKSESTDPLTADLHNVQGSFAPLQEAVGLNQALHAGGIRWWYRDPVGTVQGKGSESS